jgi:hypothetical protein
LGAGGFEGKDSLDALKYKDAEAVLIQKIEEKRRSCFVCEGAWISECQLSPEFVN